jgi:DNA-binding transcriptional LysR family regulator
MELRHIRSFLEVAGTLNFSRAAARMHIAQSALSKQIRGLEEELGGRLFHRTTTRVSLTEMGHYFQEQMRHILMQCDIAVTGARQLSKGTSGTLRVGCDWQTMGWPIAAAARSLLELNSRLSVEFVERPVYEHVTAVREREIDVGFTAAIFLLATDDLELRRICSLKMRALLPKGHRFASRARLSLKDLKGERWLALSPQNLPGYRVIMAKILQYTPKFGMTTTSMSGVIAHVIAGHGVGLIPDWGHITPQPGIVMVDTDCTPLEIFAVSAKDAPSPLIPAYLDALEAALNKSQH